MPTLLAVVGIISRTVHLHDGPRPNASKVTDGTGARVEARAGASIADRHPFISAIPTRNILSACLSITMDSTASRAAAAGWGTCAQMRGLHRPPIGSEGQAKSSEVRHRRAHQATYCSCCCCGYHYHHTR